MFRYTFLFLAGFLILPSITCAQNPALNEAVKLDRQGFVEEAIGPWKKFLESKPDPQLDVYAHIKLCLALAKSGHLGEAFLIAQQAAKRYPENFHAQFNLGNTAAALQKYPDSIAAYETLIRLNPNQGLSYVGLGLSLYGNGKTDRSLDVLREVRSLFKKQKNISWYQQVRIMIGQLKSFAPYPPDFSSLFLANNLKNVSETYQKSLFLDYETGLNLP